MKINVPLNQDGKILNLGTLNIGWKWFNIDIGEYIHLFIIIKKMKTMAYNLKLLHQSLMKGVLLVTLVLIH